MIKIERVKIYGVEEAVKYSGLSFSNKPEHSYNRAIKLSKVPVRSGHDCFLKGITVNLLLTAPHYFIIEMQRYHFIDIVSSTSKMHSLKNKNFFYFNLPAEIDEVIEERLMVLYKIWETTKEEKDFMILLANMPLGFNLKMYLTTNYLQLKTIYNQRKNHILSEWKTFIEWIKSLPLLEEVL